MAYPRAALRSCEQAEILGTLAALSARAGVLRSGHLRYSEATVGRSGQWWRGLFLLATGDPVDKIITL